MTQEELDALMAGDLDDVASDAAPKKNERKSSRSGQLPRKRRRSVASASADG